MYVVAGGFGKRVRFFDVGDQAEGVIALGQFATGVIAIGQVATGVIAIGQVARGVLAVGQGAVGIFAFGQGSLGAYYAVGMIGLGGRGFGIVLPLIPSLGARFDEPDTAPLASYGSGEQAEGWARARLVPTEEGVAVATEGGRISEARLDIALKGTAEAAVNTDVLVYVRRGEDGLVVDKIRKLPASRLRQPMWWFLWSLQLLGLVVLCGAAWVLALWPVVLFFAKMG